MQLRETVKQKEHLPSSDTFLTPMRVAKVEILLAMSPSISGRSFVMAMTVANMVTKHVMNLNKDSGKQQQQHKKRAESSSSSRRVGVSD
jgi:hypothetical protein